MWCRFFLFVYWTTFAYFLACWRLLCGKERKDSRLAFPCSAPSSFSSLYSVPIIQNLVRNLNSGICSTCVTLTAGFLPPLAAPNFPFLAMAATGRELQ
ncbi:hypothetical protein O6P43_013973 [Quillaja saponaria]|uniref:Uncharacterized protein n=1 Tax=Quillaja saponaria TaxID=32244 RepID=A0AAD7PQG2_QUISA|nr:hypothetical protein O6P43_013973 [Quillaja saponaria]